MGDVVQPARPPPQLQRTVLPEMTAAAAARVRAAGLLAAAGSRTAGSRGPEGGATPSPAAGFFHRSRPSLGEAPAQPGPGQPLGGGGRGGAASSAPPRRARNPMRAVAVAWAIGFPCGIALFLLTKREVDKNRLKQLKIRQKLKAANEGEYVRERYKLATQRTEEATETKT